MEDEDEDFYAPDEPTVPPAEIQAPSAQPQNSATPATAPSVEPQVEAPSEDVDIEDGDDEEEEDESDSV
jgi:pre-mRNA 3'-end-processing factor FIP1